MSAHHDPFTGWLRAHATAARGLETGAPLDDLEPLRALIGDARVVAVGENSHFISEFSLARRRVLRFLAERCGFTVLAFEYGFSESFAIDTWVQGAGTDDDLADHTRAAVPIGMDEPLRDLRRHNRTAVQPVRFAGVDIPMAGGSLLPALAPVADYLREVDQDLLPLVETAIGMAEPFAGASMAVAAPAWGRLSSAEKDALTAVLTRLFIRFRSVEPLYVSRSDQLSYDIALRRLEGACHTDYHFRAMAALYAGGGLAADTSAREIYMAESLLWHLERAGPGARVVLMAHNAHIQRTSISYDGHLSALPMGQHLARALGDDYFALGLTGTGGHTAEMNLDENARFGFTVEDTALEAPERGSIEAAFADAGLGLSLAGLRQAPPAVDGAPDRIRMQSAYLHTPVLESFDGILNIPESTVVPDLDDL